MTHSATMQTDMSWNKPGSLGFSISQRHMDASMTGRSPLIQVRTGSLRTAFERHGEFAGKALRRMAACSVPGIPYGRDSRDMEFVHMAGRGGRPHTPGAMRLEMREPKIMRYPGGTAQTGQGRSGEEKSASALIRDTVANPKQTDAGVGPMANVQQIQRVQQVQRVHMAVPASIHDESSLSGSAISRTGGDESAALPGAQGFASTSTVEVQVGDHRSGKQEHERTVAETGLSAVQPEPAGVPAVLTRAPIMSSSATSGNTVLRSPSGNMPRFSSPESAAPAASMMYQLSSGITAGPRRPLARSAWGKPYQQAMRTSVEARAESDSSVFRPDLERGVRAEQAAPSGADRGHARVYVARAGAQHPPLSFSASSSAQRKAMAIRSPLQIAPARLGDAFRSPHGELPSCGSSQVHAEYSTDHSMVSAHQSLHSESVPVLTSRNDNRGDNAPDIRRKAIPESADAPDNQDLVGRTHSRPDSIIVPTVLPAAPSQAVLRQAVAQRLPHKAGTSFPPQSRESRFGVLATPLAARGGHALSRMELDPVEAMPEQASGSMAKDRGIRHGNPQQSHFPVLHAALPTGQRATPVVGGEGRRAYFPASASGPAREAISVRGAACLPYLNRLSGLAEGPSLPKGIPGREAVLASFTVPPSPHSAAGELRRHGATFHRAAIAGPATVSGPGPTAIPVIHALAAVDGALQPAVMSSSSDYREEMQHKPRFSSPESSTFTPASRTFAMQVIARSTGGDGMAMQRHAGFDEGTPANPSRAASGRMDTTARPLVLAHGTQQVRQLQRMVAAIGEGEPGRGRIMRLGGEAADASTHPLPLARRESPEDQYGVVPAPHQGPGGIHRVPGNQVMAAESSVGKPNADEMAEQAWRLISERLVIEQERRGLAQWHR